MSDIQEKVKNAIRVSTDNEGITDEIADIIAAAKADLRGVGIVVADVQPDAADVTDPLIRRAVILYAKAHFGFADDQEKYIKVYDALKCFLALSEDYIKAPMVQSLKTTSRRKRSSKTLTE